MYKVVSDYAKSFLACMENTLKGNKRIWRMRQEYFAAYGEYANRHKTEIISANFHLKQKKILVHNHHTKHDRMGKKSSHATVPLRSVTTVSVSHKHNNILTLTPLLSPKFYQLRSSSDKFLQLSKTTSFCFGIFVPLWKTF